MKLIRWVNRYAEESMMVFLLSVMVVIITAQVGMRFILGSSIGWSEELARYCFIWLVFIGISYGVKKQRHIKIDAFLRLLHAKQQIKLEIIVNILFLLFAIFLLIYGGKISTQIFMWGQRSPALQVNMGLVYMAAPVAMLLTSLRLTQQLFLQFKSHRAANEQETSVN
ncbi:TRAP transporter small permease [Terribacillus halophilus]|uniref:TRAP transporter small permease n=1 Tax=Terribacillus halophilus TaxID=361279 RepID=UPI0009879C2D|nr:TRAP transporter small permease [Terribacillus halophilus]